MKTISYNNEELRLVKSSYQNNGALYVGLVDADGEHYGDITVNLPNSGTLPSDCAFVDTNNLPRIDRVLYNEEVAVPVGQSACSGFCQYHAFQFDLSEIDEL